MKFRTGYNNITETKVKEFKDLKFSAGMYLTDTTTLNQLEVQKEQIFSKIMASETYISAMFGAEAIGENKGNQLRTKLNYVGNWQTKRRKKLATIVLWEFNH